MSVLAREDSLKDSPNVSMYSKYPSQLISPNNRREEQHGEVKFSFQFAGVGKALLRDLSSVKEFGPRSVEICEGHLLLCKDGRPYC